MPTKSPSRSTKAPSPRIAAKKTVPAPKRPRAATAKRPVQIKRAKAAVRAGSSKRDRLIDLLAASPGGTIAQMMKLTGWQAHTVRGTISGVLRKKLGYRIVASATPDGTERRYRILEATGQ